MIELERDAPDLEDLAAYLDGRLAGERKAQVEERLLHDEDYYDVFVENVQFLQEHGQQSAAGEVVAPAVWWRSWKVIAPLAVAATLVVALGLPRLVLGPSTGEWVARLDAEAVTGSVEDWDSPGWRTLRGPASGSIQPDLRRRQELAFRIGTRTVHLRVALAADDFGAARQAAVRLRELTTEDFALMGFSRSYDELKDQIDGKGLDTLKTQAAELEDSLTRHGFEDSTADRYKLGKWNEAGRLAALTQNAEVLAGIWRRRRIARAIREIAPHLKELEAVLEQPEPDFEAAAAAFSGIARKLAGRG